MEHNIIHGKVYQPEFFSDELNNIVEIHGLNAFLSVEEFVYPELIEEFYANLKPRILNSGLILDSEVRGTFIRLTARKVSEWFDLPRVGVSTYEREVWITTETTDFTDYLRYMSGGLEGVQSSFRPIKNDITAEQKILVLLVRECLLPNKNKGDTLGSLECTFAYFLKHRILFNLPILMIAHIDHCKTSNKRNLPYGMVMTRIFKKSGVPLEGERIAHTLRPRLTAHNMKYFELYAIGDREYLTKEDVLRLPLAERREFVDRLGLPHKKFRIEPEPAAESEEEEGGEEEHAVGGAENVMMGEPSSAEDEDRHPRWREIRRKESHERRMLSMMSRMQRSMNLGFSSLGERMDTRFSAIEGRLDRMEERWGLQPRLDRGNR